MANVDLNFDPKNKTFTERSVAFIADAKSKYGVVIRKNSSGRTVQWQQKHHVAHMFVYNAYSKKKPANVETGSNTISWTYFSDAKTKWHTVKYADFLRTSDGKVPEKKNDAEWKDTAKPDKTKTIAHVKAMQVKAGIGGGGKAMVSSGLKPCKSPCACTVGRSKHVSGVAEDWNVKDLNSLIAKLKAAKAVSLDEYLKAFGLHRPLKDLGKRSEAWHIEAL